MQREISESLLIGRILAEQSHELKNVLAIVGEASGLMEDLLDLMQEQHPLPDAFSARLKKSLHSIHGQVQRGHGIASDLNALGHLSDTRSEASMPAVDIGHIAALAVRLMVRTARNAKVSVSTPQNCGVTVPADPLRCLTACLTLLLWVLRFCEPDSSMEVNTESGKPELEICCIPPAEEPDPSILETVEAAGLHLHKENGRMRVTLVGG